MYCSVTQIRSAWRRLIQNLTRSSEANEPSPLASALGTDNGSPLRVSLSDVIDREPVDIDADGIRTYLADRTVLVTGAGGSIGAQLSEQIVDLAPERAVFVDVSEHNLYRLERQLQTHLSARSLPGVDLHLADVRDVTAMERVFRRMRPDVVIHTAAYKHVPLMECHPYGAFQNNTLATARLLSLCERHECEQFVFVSTDKAVQPKGVLGVTKRLAEWHVRAAPSPVTRKVVRFGNVFGSRGSVVPLFEQQIRDGGPVTVTHPDMERYFMTANEACALILQTLLIASAPVFFFRMGDPVSIQHLAEVIVRRHTGTDTPGAFIEYVGCRPGEKLREDLVMTHEDPQPTSHLSIVGLHGDAPFSRDEIDARLDALATLAQDPTVQPPAFQNALFDAAVSSSASVTTALS